jgi:hypothetical protein
MGESVNIAVKVWRTLRELARELSDENAYRRYLQAAGLAHSAQAWRAFSDQKHARKYRNAKCC